MAATEGAVGSNDDDAAAVAKSPVDDPRAGRIVAVALVLNLLLLLVYLTVTSRRLFHSDTAVNHLLAEEILARKSLLPESFYYTHGLRLVHAHLLILALSPLVGTTGLDSLVASQLLLGAIFVASIWSFLRLLQLPPAARRVAALLTTCGVSAPWVDDVFGNGYAFLMLLVLGTLYASARYLVDAAGGARVAAIAWCMFALGGLFGDRGLQMLLVPAAAAIVLMTGRIPWTRVGVCAAAAGIGLLLRSWLAADLHFTPAPLRLWTLAEADRVGFRTALLDLFGLLPWAPLSAGEPASAFHGLRYVFLMLVIAANGAIFWALRHPLPRRQRFLALFHLALTLVTLYAATFVTHAEGRGRYLAPVLFTTFLTAGVVLPRLPLRRPVLWALAISALVLPISMSSYVLPLRGEPRASRPRPPLSEHDEMVALLRRAGAHRGYATFWRAGVITVATEHEIELVAVGFGDGLPVPFRHASVDRWYLPHPGGPVALVVARDREEEQLDLPRLGRLVGPPERVLESSRYRVLVYRSDALPTLPSWQLENLEEELTEAARLPGAALFTQDGVGRADGRRLVAESPSSRPGYLAFGPYVRLPPGHWEVTFDVESSAGTPGSPPSRCEIAFDRGQRVIWQAPLRPGRRRQVARLTVAPAAAGSHPVETRVYYSGAGSLVVHEIELRRLASSAR